MTSDLTDDEVDSICAGLRQNHARVRFLQFLGLTVRQKPNGRPLVNREHYNAVMNGKATAASNSPQFDGPRWSAA
jgi:hypothetical protein